MKTTNLTRREAMHAMIDGEKISHPEHTIGSYCFFHGKSFGYRTPLASHDFIAALEQEDGYFIYKPEPTFREVTMYAPVYKNAFGGAIYQSKKQAFSRLGAIGYTEVKVYLKESEDEE